jgi:hypothetical protein
LLYISLLGVTDYRDFIYAIIGITGFPVRVMTVREWIEKRQNEVFIPIDYSADLISILYVVTWVTFMKAGLGALAKFKFFDNQHE